MTVIKSRKKRFLLVANSNWESTPVQVAGPFFKHELAEAKKTLEINRPEFNYVECEEKDFEEKFPKEYIESWFSRPQHYIATFLETYDDLLDRCRIADYIIYNREIYLRIDKKKLTLNISISTIANAKSVCYLINELRTYLKDKLEIIISEEEYYLSNNNFFFTGESAIMAQLYNELNLN